MNRHNAMAYTAGPPGGNAMLRQSSSMSFPEIGPLTNAFNAMGLTQGYQPGPRESDMVEDRRPSSVDEQLRNLSQIFRDPSLQGLNRQLVFEEIQRLMDTQNLDRHVRPMPRGGQTRSFD